MCLQHCYRIVHKTWTRVKTLHAGIFTLLSRSENLPVAKKKTTRLSIIILCMAEILLHLLLKQPGERAESTCMGRKSGPACGKSPGRTEGRSVGWWFSRRQGGMAVVGRSFYRKAGPYYLEQVSQLGAGPYLYHYCPWLVSCLSRGRDYFCYARQLRLFSRLYFKKQSNRAWRLILSTAVAEVPFSTWDLDTKKRFNHRCYFRCLDITFLRQKESCLKWRSVGLIIDTAGNLRNKKATGN